MSSPCGKCNSCPCSTQPNEQARQSPCSQNTQQEQQRQPPQQTTQPQPPQQGQSGTYCPLPPRQQVTSCLTCQGPQAPPQTQSQQQNQQQPQAQTQHGKKARVECICKQKRQNTAPLQAPLADTYTCSRPRPEPQPYVPIEERCTCKAKTAPPQCECAPPVMQPVEPVQPPQTHANIYCGQLTSHSQPTASQVQQRHQQSRPPCSHCQSKKKKGCIIQ